MPYWQLTGALCPYENSSGSIEQWWFLTDWRGSMQTSNKLPVVHQKNSLSLCSFGEGKQQITAQSM